MWPFSTKFPAKETIRLADRWQKIDGQYRGEPINVRLRKGLKKIAGHPDFPFHTGIVLLADPQAKSPLSEALLSSVEKDIGQRFCSDNQSLLVGVISTAEQVEFVLFSSDPEAAKNAHQPLREAFPDLEIEMIIQADPDWAAFRRFGG